MSGRNSFVWLVSVVGMILLSSCQNQSASEARSDGERVFRAKCSTCHRLPNHAAKEDNDWTPFLTKHAKRAGLTDHQVELVSAHLVNTQ